MYTNHPVLQEFFLCPRFKHFPDTYTANVLFPECGPLYLQSYAILLILITLTLMDIGFLP